MQRVWPINDGIFRSLAHSKRVYAATSNLKRRQRGRICFTHWTVQQPLATGRWQRRNGGNHDIVWTKHRLNYNINTRRDITAYSGTGPGHAQYAMVPTQDWKVETIATNCHLKPTNERTISLQANQLRSTQTKFISNWPIRTAITAKRCYQRKTVLVRKPQEPIVLFKATE